MLRDENFFNSTIKMLPDSEAACGGITSIIYHSTASRHLFSPGCSEPSSCLTTPDTFTFLLATLGYGRIALQNCMRWYHDGTRLVDETAV